MKNEQLIKYIKEKFYTALLLDRNSNNDNGKYFHICTVIFTRGSSETVFIFKYDNKYLILIRNKGYFLMNNEKELFEELDLYHLKKMEYKENIKFEDLYLKNGITDLNEDKDILKFYPYGEKVLTAEFQDDDIRLSGYYCAILVHLHRYNLSMWFQYTTDEYDVSDGYCVYTTKGEVEVTVRDNWGKKCIVKNPQELSKEKQKEQEFNLWTNGNINEDLIQGLKNFIIGLENKIDIIQEINTFNKIDVDKVNNIIENLYKKDNELVKKISNFISDLS